MDEVIEGAILVEATDLAAVMSFEDIQEIVKEVLYLDDRLIGDGRQANLHGIGIRAHRFTWMPDGAA
jgi:hypothetical protein